MVYYITSFIAILSTIYTNTKSAIKGLESMLCLEEALLSLNPEIRKIFVIMPTLFNTCVDWLMGEHGGNRLVNLGHIK